MSDLQNLKFPIGEFSYPKMVTKKMIDDWITIIADFPSQLRGLTANLSTEELQLTYRPDGWNIKQVVHHCADSHINSIMRFKLTLTEDLPIIKPYLESEWAKLIDGNEDDISDSLMLLDSLHRKWVKVLRNMSESDLGREFIHPEHGSRVTLKENIAIYSWHCAHHLTHVKLALSKKN